MQLGELQQHLQEFDTRGITVVAISVDTPQDSEGMIERMGLSFAIASDPGLSVIRAFSLENHEVGEMAIHATYIVSQDRKVIYRKVARRRPMSGELLDAIDAHRGTYTGPRDAPEVRRRSPWQDWKLLDAVALVENAPPLPDTLSAAQRSELAAILGQLVAPHEDPALRLWRAYCQTHLTETNADDILQQGRRLMWKAYLEGVDVAGPRDEVRASSRALEDAGERRASAAARDADPSELERLEAGVVAARRSLREANTRLGDLSQGHLRSLWDLKSMLKAMEELHAAQVRRVKNSSR